MSWRDDAKQRVKEKQQGSTITINEGLNCLRIMPDRKDLTAEGKLNPKGCVHPPYREFRTHRDVGPDKEFLGCGKNIEEQGDCWLCDVIIPQLEGSNDAAKRELAHTIRAQEKFAVNASRFDIPTKRFSLPKPWWVSTGSGIPGRQGMSLAVRVYSKIANSRKDLVDPIRGFNLNVERTGQLLKTRYPEVEADETPTTVPQAVLMAVKDLDTIIPIYDEEDQRDSWNAYQRIEQPLYGSFSREIPERQSS